MIGATASRPSEEATMASEQPRSGWLARRREKRQLKRERTGDTPQRVAEGERSQGPVKDAVGKAPVGGGLIGGGPVGM
jgi:hypothetical protein